MCGSPSVTYCPTTYLIIRGGVKRGDMQERRDKGYEFDVEETECLKVKWERNVCMLLENKTVNKKKETRRSLPFAFIRGRRWILAKASDGGYKRKWVTVWI